MVRALEQPLIKLGRRRQGGWGSHARNVVALRRRCRTDPGRPTERYRSGAFPGGDRRMIVGSRADLDGAARRPEARLLEPLGVDLLERLPLGRDLVLGEDGVDRADRLARRAIDALVRLDVEHAAALVD